MNATTDRFRIDTVEALRATIGHPHERTREKIWSGLDANCIEFIGRAPFLLLSTADARGNQEVSPKGDGPGFVLVEDESTVAVPDRPGNKLAFGLLNIIENPHVGMIFVVPGTSETLRLNGRAEITIDPDLLGRLCARGKPPKLAIRVHVDEVFFHCAKAFLRSRLWEPESWPERLEISFGKMMAARRGAGDDVAELIDRRVEEDYRTNL